MALFYDMNDTRKALEAWVQPQTADAIAHTPICTLCTEVEEDICPCGARICPDCSETCDGCHLLICPCQTAEPYGRKIYCLECYEEQAPICSSCTDYITCDGCHLLICPCKAAEPYGQLNFCVECYDQIMSP